MTDVSCLQIVKNGTEEKSYNTTMQLASAPLANSSDHSLLHPFIQSLSHFSRFAVAHTWAHERILFVPAVLDSVGFQAS